MSDLLGLYLWVLYFVGAGCFYSAFNNKEAPASVAFVMFVLSPVLVPVLVGVSLNNKG